GVGFAIPSRIARKVATELIQYGQVRQGWLGIVMYNVDEDLAKFYGLSTPTGVLVMDVVANSPAEIAGVKRYDLVLSLNGEELSSPLEMLQKTASKDIGEKVELKILRLQNDKKQEIKLEIKLGARPEEKELLKLQESKKLIRTYDELGLRVTALTEEGTAGVEIIDVKQDSPADKAGLLKGDVIVEINTRKLMSLEDYRQTIKKPDGDKLLIRYSRAGKEELAILKLK
ncbi:MAG: PDZ domain-containing protein, partial [Candidatus Sumerlaeia bacterium]|nr:PDZ domain-containing protein [Candidatus Sumerlaeia bacterium]